MNLIFKKIPQRLNCNYFSVLFYFVDEEAKARQSHTAETHSWGGWVPTPTQELSSLGPSDKQFYVLRVELFQILSEKFDASYKAFIPRDVCLSLHSSATVGFSSHLPRFCSGLLVDGVPVLHLRPYPKKQRAMGGYGLGFWRTQHWAQVLALFGNRSYLGQVT